MNRETAKQPALEAPHASPWLIALLALLAAVLYLLLHPYLGITHDARLYSLQALNHLRPDLYANDIFLRYGSQDNYTLFTPLYARLISVFGVDPAAALMTFASQLLFLSAVVMFALKLMPARSALFALCLLLLLPGHYGSQKIFCYLEPFVTPRLLAESLVLLGITAWSMNRRAIAIVLLMGAMVTHPIMGLPGVALLVCMEMALTTRRRYWLPAAVLVPIGSFLVLLTMSTHWRFDDDWLGIVLARAEYLSLRNWSMDDWGRVATVAATLLIAWRRLAGDQARLAIALSLSTSVLMVLTLVGGDWLHITLVMQAQPWRGLWLATVVAILLLPPLFLRCWNDTPLRRGGMLLLAAAWLSPSENLALLMAPLALAATEVSIGITSRISRLLIFACYIALATAAANALAVAFLAWKTGTYNVAIYPAIDVLRGISTGGALPLAFLLLVCWAATRYASFRWGSVGVLALLVVAIGIPTFRAWTDVRYDSRLIAAFADWRRRIPPGSDVMWAAETSTGADSATSAWLLLERPNYVSRIQATTSLFSRQAALEIRRRMGSLHGLLPDMASLYPREPLLPVHRSLTLSRVCRSSDVKYIVTSTQFPDAPAIAAPAGVRNPFRHLKLYICP